MFDIVRRYSFVVPAGAWCLCATPAGASTLTVIYSASVEKVPNQPVGAPLPVAFGQIIGVLPNGGDGSGEVFTLAPRESKGLYKKTVIHAWQAADGATDGRAPSSDLTTDPHGNVWGTTEGNGANGTGTLYELLRPATAAGSWTYRLVMSFPAQFYHGIYGSGFDTLTFDGAGNLYGLLRGSLTSDLSANLDGTIFELTAAQLAAGSGKPEVLYSFPLSDHSYPSGLTRDSHGNFFGVEPNGGPNQVNDYGAGALWEVSPPKRRGGAWTRQTLYNFCSDIEGDGFNACIDGYAPYGPVAVDASGAIYGSTFFGGLCQWVGYVYYCGNGILWSYVPAASSFAVLHTLLKYNADGTHADYDISNPGGVVLNGKGEVVTAVQTGGALNDTDTPIDGGVIDVGTAGGAIGLINNSFGVNTGDFTAPGPITPSSPPVLDKQGRIYGATSGNMTATGANNGGVIYMITP
jgi:hypothetical protein